MTRAHRAPRDLGPEFARRFDRDVQRFSRSLFEIGRESDRFARADRIQAECDLLLAIDDEGGNRA